MEKPSSALTEFLQSIADNLTQLAALIQETIRKLEQGDGE